MLPGHGPELPSAGEAAERYLAHREQRLEQVRAARRGRRDERRRRSSSSSTPTSTGRCGRPPTLSVRAQLEHLRGATRDLPVCGTPTVPGARFCFACGAQLPASSVSDAGTERRVVTVLFGDLSDFTSWSEDLDPERVGVVTDRVLATLAAAVAEFGGQSTSSPATGSWPCSARRPPTRTTPSARSGRPPACSRPCAASSQEESGGGRRLGLRVGLNTGEVVAGVQASLSLHRHRRHREHRRPAVRRGRRRRGLRRPRDGGRDDVRRVLARAARRCGSRASASR